MSCPKCDGLQIAERSYSMNEGEYLVMDRCVLCGFYDDATCRANRKVTNTDIPRYKRNLSRYETSVLCG